MLSKNEILKKINGYLIFLSRTHNQEIILNQEFFKEYDTYFTFNYNTKSYLVDGNVSDALVGNAMVVIEKGKGEMFKVKNRELDIKNINVFEALKNEDIVAV